MGEPENGPLPLTKSAFTSILDFLFFLWPPELWGGKKVSVYKPPSLWYSVLAAPTEQESTRPQYCLKQLISGLFQTRVRWSKLGTSMMGTWVLVLIQHKKICAHEYLNSIFLLIYMINLYRLWGIFFSWRNTSAYSPLTVATSVIYELRTNTCGCRALSVQYLS